jgi:hypothetical protein
MVVTWYSNWDSIGQFGSVFNFAWQEFILNATVGSWIACAFYLLSCAREREKRKTALLLSLVVAATVWSCAMSAGITEIGAFLSVAIALGALVDYGRKSVAVSLVAMIMVISISSGSWWKYEGLPRYSWWGYSTVSPEVVKARSSKGLTKGLLWDASALEAFEKTQEVLSRAKSCGGEVVVFPHVPLFQLDANLLPGGRLATYWYDFSTQDEIQLEVARLKRVKISAIVLLELPDTVVEGHELLFNDGAPLAHRQMYDFLSKIGPGSMTDVIQAPVGPDTFWHVFADNCSATS